MNPTETDVLIVGAGPTGLTLACECQRYGVRHRIIERATARTGLSKALGIWNGTLEAFAAMGLVDDFLIESLPLNRLRFADRGRTIMQMACGQGIDSLYPQPLLLPQSDTERLLEAHLERLGGRVERGLELVSVCEQADTVAAQLRGSDGRVHACQARWVAGCDGAHSAVRHAAGIEFAGVALAENFLLCDAEVAGTLSDDEILISWSGQGGVAIFPVRAGVWRVVARRDDASNLDEPTLEEVQSHVDRHGPPGLRLHNPSWLTSFRIHERLATRFRAGRLFLLGDAAHIHSPAGGQGMNTGIQDATNLAWKLALMAAGGNADVLAESYHAERRPVARDVLEKASQKLHLAMANGPVLRVAKDLLLGCIGQLGMLQRGMLHELSELAIRYLDSPLLQTTAPWPRSAGRDGYPVGSRPRDCLLLAPSSTEPVSLWRQFLDRRHTLLVFSGDLPTDDDRGRLAALLDAVHGRAPLVRAVGICHGMTPLGLPDGVPWLLDPQGDAHRQFGMSTTGWYLVRPDQYAAVRCQPAEIEPLVRYLATIAPGCLASV